MNGVRLSRQYLKFIIEKNEGRVIFIASEAAIMLSQEMVHYSATKTMQLSLSRSLAELTKGTKATVNTVMPGSTLTEGVETMLHTLYPGEKLTIEEAETRFRRLFKQSVIIGNKWLSLADRRGIGAKRILTYKKSHEVRI
jgi:3-oxoacyl-[acyl-carrier protein] reductase